MPSFEDEPQAERWIEDSELLARSYREATADVDEEARLRVSQQAARDMMATMVDDAVAGSLELFKEDMERRHQALLAKLLQQR